MAEKYPLAPEFLALARYGDTQQLLLVRDTRSGTDCLAAGVRSPDAMSAGVRTGLQAQVAQLRQLSDRRLPKFIDVITVPDRCYWFLFEPVLGEPLDIRLATATRADLFQWVLDLVELLAVMHAHSPPWLIGPLNPGKILVGPHGLCLLDLRLEPRFFPQKMAHAPPGTAFQAPEVSSGATPGPAADVFSAGALALWLLTGFVPEPGDKARPWAASLRDLPDLLTCLETFVGPRSSRPLNGQEALARLRAVLPRAAPAVDAVGPREPPPAVPVAVQSSPIDAAPLSAGSELADTLRWHFVSAPLRFSAVLLVLGCLGLLAVRLLRPAPAPDVFSQLPVLRLTQGTVLVRHPGHAHEWQPDRQVSVTDSTLMCPTEQGALLQSDNGSSLHLSGQALVRCTGYAGDRFSIVLVRGALDVDTGPRISTDVQVSNALVVCPPGCHVNIQVRTGASGRLEGVLQVTQGNVTVRSGTDNQVVTHDQEVRLPLGPRR